jgi:hypothetical protein
MTAGFASLKGSGFSAVDAALMVALSDLCASLSGSLINMRDLWDQP